MTKRDIMYEFNSLTSTLNKTLEDYKALTGIDYERPGKINDMDPSDLLYYKDDLERQLDWRKQKITSIKNDMEKYSNMQNMKESENGNKFLEDLNKKKEELENAIIENNTNAANSLYKLLETMGLTGWELQCPESFMDRVFSKSYYTLQKDSANKKSWYTTRMSIGKEKGVWTMEVSSGCSGGVNIHDKNSSDYNQFKFCVTIMENDELVQVWMNTIMNNYAKKNYDLNEELRKVERMVEDPYEAWRKSMNE